MGHLTENMKGLSDKFATFADINNVSPAGMETFQEVLFGGNDILAPTSLYPAPTPGKKF